MVTAPPVGRGARERIVAAVVALDLAAAALVASETLARLGAIPVAPAAPGPRRLLLGAGWLLAAATIGLLAHRRWRRLAAATALAGLAAWYIGTHGLASPVAALRWAVGPTHDAAGRSAAWVGLGAGLVSLVAVLAATVGLLPRDGRGADDTTGSGAYGTAAWDSGDALRQPRGLIIGRAPRRRRGDDTLRYAGEGHLLTVAPTRAGKGTGAVIPALLTHQGSMVVTDLKGENVAVTARARRAMGQRVLTLDPFGVATASSAGYNPLDRIDPSATDAIDDARALADMLVVASAPGTTEAFWDEEARALLVGLILHAAADPDPAGRTLSAVRQALCRGPRPFAALLRAMAASTAAGGAVARSAGQIAQKSPRERSAVLSTAQSHTHFLDSPRIAAVMERTILPPDAAAAPGAPSTLYLVLPPEHLDGYRRWLRLMIGSTIQRLTRRRQPAGSRTLFLLDEFAQLGRMRPVEQGVTLAAGYGASFWLLVQDLAQLRAVYGDAAQTFLANADVLQAFGVTDWETAEHLSRLAGETTVAVETASASRASTNGRLAHSQAGESASRSERGRRLITPDEVRLLPADRSLLIVRGMSAIAARRVDYRTDPAFHGQFDPNPLHAP